MDILIYVIIAVVVILILWIISASNSLNRAQVKIEEAESGIDVALEKRYDVLTKMIEVVKGYAKHEKETLFEVINLRKGMSVDEKAKESEKMDANFEKINVLAESYPELRSSENYKTLQQAIADTEEHLQAARRMYNANISKLNQMVVAFPTSMVASMMGVGKKDFFEVEESKKEDVKMDL